jgi:hypothetical protein
MGAGIVQYDAVEDIVNEFRGAVIDSVIKTGYAHFEFDCSIINREKDIVRMELKAGTNYSRTVSRKELTSNLPETETDEIETDPAIETD